MKATMAPMIETIGGYGTHRKITVDFFGKELIVTETETPSVIRRWIYSALFYHSHFRYSHRLVVGVGVQWTPNLTNSGSYRYDSSPPPDPEADTLQLCVGRRCIIIKLTNCDRVPRILRRFLADSRITFVGVWNGQDEKKLAQSRHRLKIGKLLDVKDYVTDSTGESLNRFSFEVIVARCLGYQGVSLEKRISMSDWSVEILDLEQILQATVDAYVCFDLGVTFRLWEV